MFRKVVSDGLYFSPKAGTRFSPKISASRAESFRERFCKCHQWSMGKGGWQWESGICLGGEGESSGNCKIPLQLAVNLLFPGVPKSHVFLRPCCHSSEGAAFPDTANATIGMKPWKESMWNGRKKDFFIHPSDFFLMCNPIWSDFFFHTSWYPSVYYVIIFYV